MRADRRIVYPPSFLDRLSDIGSALLLTKETWESARRDWQILYLLEMVYQGWSIELNKSGFVLLPQLELLIRRIQRKWLRLPTAGPQVKLLFNRFFTL